MTESEKFMWIDKLAKRSIELAKLQNQTEQGIKYLEMVGQIITDVWNAGHAEGFKEGKESRFDIKKN